MRAAPAAGAPSLAPSRYMQQQARPFHTMAAGASRRSTIVAAATADARARPVLVGAATNTTSAARPPTNARARRALTITASATGSGAPNPRAARLRSLLSNPPGPYGILQGPCCHDALSARLIQDAGFDFAFMSGFCTAASRLAVPDTGLISYGEMVSTGRNLHEATSAPFPIIGDGDTGYGNAMNVRRTVQGYAAAGFAGVLIEDQAWPKSCGHVKGKRVVAREEAVQRVRAAADARDASGTGIVLVARSDARQATGSLDEALWRAAAFADAGADVVFIDALESEEEMRALCRVARQKGVFAMANMLEGGGKTPILPPETLANMGFALVAYPMSLLGVSIKAMRGALVDLKQGRLPPPEKLGTFAEIQSAVGFDAYFREEARYAVDKAEDVVGSGGGGGGAAAPAAVEEPGPVVVEPDAVVEESGGRQSLVPLSPSSSSSSSSSSSGGNNASNRAPSSRALEALKRSRFFRVSIRDRATGTTKLETRIPASFVGGLAALVPQVAGVDLDALLSEIAGGGDVAADLMSKPLVDVDAGGDRVQVFLE